MSFTLLDNKFRLLWTYYLESCEKIRLCSHISRTLEKNLQSQSTQILQFLLPCTSDFKVTCRFVKNENSFALLFDDKNSPFGEDSYAYYDFEMNHLIISNFDEVVKLLIKNSSSLSSLSSSSSSSSSFRSNILPLQSDFLNQLMGLIVLHELVHYWQCQYLCFEKVTPDDLERHAQFIAYTVATFLNITDKFELLVQLMINYLKSQGKNPKLFIDRYGSYYKDNILLQNHIYKGGYKQNCQGLQNQSMAVKDEDQEPLTDDEVDEGTKSKLKGTSFNHISAFPSADRKKKIFKKKILSHLRKSYKKNRLSSLINANHHQRKKITIVKSNL